MSNLQIIAEIGSNWNGDISLGKKIIRSSKNSGCDYVKFQMWKANELFEKSDKNWNYMKKSEFSKSAAIKLKKYSDDLGIECFWSVFYPEAVPILEDLNVKCYKIASWTAAEKHPSALYTMNEIAKTRKPVIISMGYGGDLKKIYNIFKKNKKFFLYCISDYPAKLEKIDFKKMIQMDGFSDHTEGSLAPLVYAIKSKNSKKTRFLEKHISVPKSRGPDKPFAMDISNFSLMVKDLRQVEKLKYI
jgi:sialic acid synthase SpsE